MSVDTCSAALKACADGEQWQGSVSLLFCMDQLHLQPDALSFSPVISACRNWQLGLLLFHNMVSRQLKPNVITCNAVLSMCEGSGRWQQAILLLTRLHAENIEPDTMSYNLALGACTKAKRWRAAAALFLQMGRIHVPGNAMTFSRLIEQREMSSFDFRSCDLLQGAGIRSLTRLCDRGGSLFQKKGSSACAFRSFTATLIPCLSCDISSTAIHLTNVARATLPGSSLLYYCDMAASHVLTCRNAGRDADGLPRSLSVMACWTRSRSTLGSALLVTSQVLARESYCGGLAQAVRTSGST